MNPISRALISVSDKTGVVDFARALRELGVEILSTGGTAKLLADSGVAVVEVGDYTGFPEMMEGRVKTLHPKIHGGILGRRGVDDAVMAAHGIGRIDLVVVNLYPFEQTVARARLRPRDGHREHRHRRADRAAGGRQEPRLGDGRGRRRGLRPRARRDARQRRRRDRRPRASIWRRRSSSTRRATTARSRATSARVWASGVADFPRTCNLQFHLAQGMRYGENPHQKAAFYVEPGAREASVATARQLQGKELSYNNIGDTDAALECVKQFDEGPACVIVKHANPCGVAYGANLLEAYDRAYATDPESAFGGIIAFNGELDGKTAKAIVDRQFVEVIVAPTVSDAAVAAVAAKKNVRLLACGGWDAAPQGRLDFKRVTGGLLVQDADLALVGDVRVVSRRVPTEAEMRDLLFTWRVAKFVKSNAIVYGRDRMTVGVGAGQMSRVNSARIASIKAEQAGLEVRGAVMASDAFFPFRDGIDQAARAGIAAVIQPGGSMRDDEVIAAADEHGMAMVFTGMRHFRH